MERKLHGNFLFSASELHYRNSLAPLHLRSTYLAQYPEHNLREEDIKVKIISIFK